MRDSEQPDQFIGDSRPEMQTCAVAPRPVPSDGEEGATMSVVKV